MNFTYLSKETNKVIYDIVNLFYINNVNIYVVGGFVRDSLLGIKSKDIDLVVEADVLEYTEKLMKLFTSKLKFKVIKNDHFHTISVIFQSIVIDIVSSRREVYPKNGDIPNIFIDSIAEDLIRRDFTINSVYYKLLVDSLNKKIIFGELISHNLSLSDIKNCKLRAIHSNTFTQDPTRIFRAIRYLSRFEFKFEKTTLKQLTNATLDKKTFQNTSYNRFINEIKKDLNEKNFKKIVDYYIKFDLCGIIFGLYKNKFKNIEGKFIEAISYAKANNISVDKKFIVKLFYYFTTNNKLEVYDFLKSKEKEFIKSINNLINLLIDPENEYKFFLVYTRFDDDKKIFFNAVISKEFIDLTQNIEKKASKLDFFSSKDLIKNKFGIEIDKHQIKNLLIEINEAIYKSDIKDKNLLDLNKFL
ncbi:tRNA nucleotidyltransferase/poly(A) polymerase family protein [Helicovermis profundi]|uniref:Poly A polymerase head domain-containing protein n=1 Tax=Helicovermis profundi TaxID=3065157 RepID=A0AAU9E362_9FIRM|nr:hypothetical protein HLPR_13870 [Clostridia bacterium S502]